MKIPSSPIEVSNFLPAPCTLTAAFVSCFVLWPFIYFSEYSLENGRFWTTYVGYLEKICIRRRWPNLFLPRYVSFFKYRINNYYKWLIQFQLSAWQLLSWINELLNQLYLCKYDRDLITSVLPSLFAYVFMEFDSVTCTYLDTRRNCGTIFF